MGQAASRNAADAAFDAWLRMGLRAHYGAVATAPVPGGLIRLAQDCLAKGRIAPATPFRAWGTEHLAPARGVVVGVLLSGLFWAALAASARTLWE